VLLRDFEPVMNEEVDKVFWAPLALFLSSEHYSPLPVSETLTTSLFKVHLQSAVYQLLQVGDETVFGITSVVAIVVSMLVHSRGPDFDINLWSGAMLGRESWPDALHSLLARAADPPSKL
jgi:hypothetical protein